MILPFVMFAALTSAIIYALTGGKKGWQEQAQGLPPGTIKKRLDGLSGDEFSRIPDVEQQPLSPQETRLLTYLVLFARDKVNRANEKKYLSYGGAKEAIALARQMRMPRTAQAIIQDGPVPEDEHLPSRNVSVRKSVVSFGTTGKA